MKKLFITVLFSFFSINVQASFGGSCSTFMQKLVNIIGISTYKVPALEEKAVVELQEFLKNNFSELKKISFNDIYYNEGKYLLSILPKSTIMHLKKYPEKREDVIKFKEDLSNNFGLGSNSVFNNIFSILSSVKRRGGDISVEIDRAIDEYNNLPEVTKNELKLEFERGQFNFMASHYWTNFGKIPLELIENFNSLQVKVGENIYTGKRARRRGNEIIILRVPVSKVKHPAWNPLDHQYLAKLASDPFSSTKKEFDVVVGHDGFFYLMDGNHRFTFYTGIEVNVIISTPAQTVSLKNYFDLINVSQPSASEIGKIYQGIIDPYEMIPSYISRSLELKSNN